MNGPQHFKEAERLRDCASAAYGTSYQTAAYFNAAAQVHALLANAAAQVDPWCEQWNEAVA